MKANLLNVLLLSTISIALGRRGWPSSSTLRPRGSTTSQTVGFLAPNLGSAIRNPSKHAAQRHRRRGRIEAFDSPVERYTSGDWLENLASLPTSKILRRITSHLVVNTAWSAAVSAAYIHYAPSITEWDVSPMPHTLMSGALGLLLVFRTNAAYDRWWEARKVWGCVTNTLRNVARTGRIALKRQHHRRFASLLVAYSIMMRQHLSRNMDFSELEGVLPSEEIEELIQDPNPPVLVISKLGDMIYQELDHDSVQSLYLQQLVGSLCDYLGMCERILMTPVPPSYSRHTSRFLSVYCFTLPLIMVKQTLFFTAPAVAAICWGLFSIEEIGATIEQPFGGQLPLAGYTRNHRQDIERLMRLDASTASPSTVEEEQQEIETFNELFERPPEEVEASGVETHGQHTANVSVL